MRRAGVWSARTALRVPRGAVAVASTLVALLVPALVPVLGAQPRASRFATRQRTRVADTSALVALEARVHAADLHPTPATAAFLDSTLAPDFTFTGATGAVRDRAQMIARWTRRDSAFARADYLLLSSALANVRVIRRGDAAVVTSRVVEQARDTVGPYTERLRVTTTWTRDANAGGRWRALAMHISLDLTPATAGTAGTAEARRGVREARAQWNAAMAARDTVALGALLADSVALSSPFLRRTGRAAYVTFFARVAARRPDLVLRFSTERVTTSGDWPAGATLAAEEGTWGERWTEAGTPVVMRGRYLAVWQRGPAGWRLTAETFVPLDCDGATYCAR